MTAGERTDTAQTDEVLAEVSQPGLGELREAVANHLRRLPLRGSLRQDAIAGLNSAVSSVPDGMGERHPGGRQPDLRPVRLHGRTDCGRHLLQF